MSDSERHAMKMAKKKAARDKIMATKTDEKGLIIVHTGKGKGKSSAAFGMIFRHIAHGMQCAVVQFIKGGMSTGERDLILGKFSDICSFHTMGEGFTWETQDRQRDIDAARALRRLGVLRRCPSLALPVLDHRHGYQRLHLRVGEEGHGIVRAVLCFRFRHRAVDIADIAHDIAGLRCRRPHLGEERLAVEVPSIALRPLDVQRVAPLGCRVGVARDHGDTAECE